MYSYVNGRPRSDTHSPNPNPIPELLSSVYFTKVVIFPNAINEMVLFKIKLLHLQ